MSAGKAVTLTAVWKVSPAGFWKTMKVKGATSLQDHESATMMYLVPLVTGKLGGGGGGGGGLKAGRRGHERGVRGGGQLGAAGTSRRQRSDHCAHPEM